MRSLSWEVTAFAAQSICSGGMFGADGDALALSSSILRRIAIRRVRSCSTPCSRRGLAEIVSAEDKNVVPIR